MLGRELLALGTLPVQPYASSLGRKASEVYPFSIPSIAEWHLKGSYGHFVSLYFYLSSARLREGYGGGLSEAQGINLPEWSCALGSRSSGWHRLL